MLQAVKDFAWEEFGAKHRYALVPHTDEPHSHVNVFVKAMGYNGKCLNIRERCYGNGGGNLRDIYASFGGSNLSLRQTSLACEKSPLTSGGRFARARAGQTRATAPSTAGS